MWPNCSEREWFPPSHFHPFQIWDNWYFVWQNRTNHKRHPRHATRQYDDTTICGAGRTQQTLVPLIVMARFGIDINDSKESNLGPSSSLARTGWRERWRWQADSQCASHPHSINPRANDNVEYGWNLLGFWIFLLDGLGLSWNFRIFEFVTSFTKVDEMRGCLYVLNHNSSDAWLVKWGKPVTHK